MKKVKMAILSCAMAAVMASSVLFAACSFGGDDTPSEPVVYTIQYTDDAGTHTINVEAGDPYSIETIPQREGYDFVGLFDAEVGGTQYVSASGSSLSPFTDGKNMVLFPQYKAKQYTVVLDYQGAAVTGDRQLTVNYGESLPELPKNLTLDHSTFNGWYTQPDCKGVQVADQYGLIPLVSVINSDNFDLSTQYINLYAGFAVQQFTVTFNFGAGVQSQEMQVDYNTPISQIVPDARNEEGEAVLSWSTSQSGGNIFTGNITGDTVLYAVEWAPVIELDSNGGDTVTPIVAKVGTSVTLPTPTRANYKFMGWQDEDGEIVEIATMPAGGAKLTASWQAMLVFDENGGTEVSDISQPVGTAITLPTPEKEGYIFAGWYTSDKTKYTATSMPAAGVALKAGWYLPKVKTFGPGTKEGYSSVLDPGESDGPEEEWRNTYDLSDVIPADGAYIHIKYIFNARLTTSGRNIRFGIYLYDSTLIGNTYLLGSDTVEVALSSNKEFTIELDLNMKSNILYMAYYARNISTEYSKVWFSRIALEVTYPDTSYLYL